MTEPMLSTIGRNGVPGLWIFGVPYLRGVMFAVGKRWLYICLFILLLFSNGFSSSLSFLFFCWVFF